MIESQFSTFSKRLHGENLSLARPSSLIRDTMRVWKEGRLYSARMKRGRFMCSIDLFFWLAL